MRSLPDIAACLLSDCNLIDHVPKVNGFFSLYLREPHEVTRRLYGSTNYNLPLLDFLGVSQLSHAQELFAWQHRTNAMPFVTAGQVPVFISASESLDAVFAGDFDPRRVAYLPPEARPVANIGTNACRVLSSEVKGKTVSAEVEASGPSLVVFSQAYSHLWKAFVDGGSAPLLKANHAYQAVVVPAGKHSIELRYVDGPFRIGAIVSALGLLFCVLYAVCRRPGKSGVQPVTESASGPLSSC